MAETPPPVYPALMQPRITQPAARPFRVVASERHYPLLGWRRCWTSGDPHPFAFEDASRSCAPGVAGWRVEATERTDAGGWRYGTAFSRLGDHRHGGRAAKRSTDRCRRRVWVHCVDAGPAPRTEEEPEAEEDGVALFWRVISQTLGRRPLQDYPMDPSSWYRVRKSHERSYDAWLAEAHVDVPPSDLRDLAHAFLYCRAAYGFAMHEGHMDSIGNAAALFTYKKVAYFDPAEDCCASENTRALRAMVGLSSDAVLGARWSTQAYKPSFFVAVDKERKWVVLGIRGTVATRDLLADVTASQVKFRTGRAHLGFLRCAAYIEKAALPALREAHAKYADHALVLCGHSMGASVAALLALAHLDDDVWPAFEATRVFCMAAGPCVSRDLAEACRPFCLGAVRGRDPIARLSVLSVEGLLDELVDQGLGRRLSLLLFGATPIMARGGASVRHDETGVDDGEVPLSGFTADAPTTPPTKGAPAPINSTLSEAPSPVAAPEAEDGFRPSRAIAAALAETESAVREPLLLPGEAVHVDQREEGPVAFASSASDYERLLVSNALLGHHLPAGYCDLLLELSGAYDADEQGDERLAALRARVLASDWSRPEFRGALA